MSVCQFGQACDGMIAHRGDCFQGHVSRPLDCPFVVLLQEQCADEADACARLVAVAPAGQSVASYTTTWDTTTAGSPSRPGSRTEWLNIGINYYDLIS